MDMDQRITKILKKNKIEPEEIMYIRHRDNHTYIYTADQRESSTYIPLKHIYSVLPKDSFINIQKGVVVSVKFITNIDSSGMYTMADGTVFKGRSRMPSQHRKVKKTLEASYEKYSSPAKAMSLVERCKVHDNSPIAFCLIELVFNDNGHGVDFIVRYCNKQMERIESIESDKILNRSFCEVYKNFDKKWIVPFADVAMNGKVRRIEIYNKHINKTVDILCYQPEPGYCACFMKEIE